MRFVVALLAVAVSAPSVFAQTDALVRLTTGTLRVGQRLAVVTESDLRSDMFRSPDPDSFHVRRTASEDAERTVVAVASDRVTNLLEVPGWTRGHLATRGGYVDTTEMDGRMFPVGTSFRIERKDLQWGYTRQPVDTVGTLYGEALDVAWIARSARVGETWRVSQDSLLRMFPALAGNGAMHLRLDSTGRFDGNEAVFLSYTLDVTVSDEPGDTVRTVEEGRIVRWPALGLDARLERTTARNARLQRPDGYRASSVIRATYVERRRLVR